jgi:hypothetical protein
MYLNTTYKAFVAKAAAGLMQEMVGEAISKGKIDIKKSWSDNEQMYKHLAVQSTLAAKALAQELNKGWTGEDGGKTVFFDVHDSLTSKLEEAVGDVAQKLEDLTEEVKKLAKNEEA